MQKILFRLFLRLWVQVLKAQRSSTMMGSSLKLSNDTVRMQQSAAALAIVSMKNWYEDPKGKEEIKQQIPDLRHQGNSLRLVQGAGRWNQTGTALKSKEDRGTWKVLSAAFSKNSKTAILTSGKYIQTVFMPSLNLLLIFRWKCTTVESLDCFFQYGPL